jgi:very-short-patch-repair endonuclease
VRHLAGYLDFAERGMEALALDLGPSGRGTDSPFEDSVIDVIRSWGYLVEPQVGAAGYRIDIGVRHPAQHGVFALGVECDGVMYHSSPAARDRDRLRDQVLRGLGWNLHRIWGTAWYRNRKQEEQRLLAAINAAIVAPIRGRLSAVNDLIERPVVETAEVDRDAVPEWTSPYQMASVTPLPRWVNPSDPASRFDMTTGIEEIATVEGPVHIDVVLQRLREAWNIGRIGSNIRTNINSAIKLAHVVRDDDFIDVPGRTVASVRVPAHDFQRKVEQVADSELDMAITSLVRSGGTVNQDDVMTATARIYGWNRRGPEITARLTGVIKRLLANGTLTGNAAALSVNDR